MNSQIPIPKTVHNFYNLLPRPEWSFKESTRRETNSFTHGYHRYPAKFIPQIVSQLIKEYAPNGDEYICDPFGGCGTTLVESKITGRKSIGFDINPIAKLITQVKTTPISPIILNKYKKYFLDEYKKIKYGKSLKHNIRIRYWFNGNTVKALDRIYFAIKKIKNKEVKRFFLCAFSHNLKNCSRWLMKSIKPTIDKNKTTPKPIESFLKHLEHMIKKNEEYYIELKDKGFLGITADMYRKDATKKWDLKKEFVDLVITSPPYVTSYEYADLHQLSLLWFGDDSNHFKKWHKFSNNFNNFRSQFIGTSHKKSNDKELSSSKAIDIINELEIIDKSLSTNVANYFADMKKVFNEMYRVLKPGGKACIIIGNTELRNIKILNAEVAAEQMLNIGFKKIDFIKREVPNKMITPWRDAKTGKFTGLKNPNKKRAYEFEFIIIMEK